MEEDVDRLHDVRSVSTVVVRNILVMCLQCHQEGDRRLCRNLENVQQITLLFFFICPGNKRSKKTFVRIEV